MYDTDTRMSAILDITLITGCRLPLEDRTQFSHAFQKALHQYQNDARPQFKALKFEALAKCVLAWADHAIDLRLKSR
jgi:hypothetical protein